MTWARDYTGAKSLRLNQWNKAKNAGQAGVLCFIGTLSENTKDK
jgi:hypothetical protein